MTVEGSRAASRRPPIHPYIDRLRPAAELLQCSAADIEAYVGELARSGIEKELQSKVSGVSGFESADFRSIEAFSLYRTLLYVIVRARRPQLIIETGVLHGFGSTFLLAALAENGSGRLVSIDLPSRDGSLVYQGTFTLPDERPAGWVIPDRLRERQHVMLGRSESLLPEAIAQFGAPDIFLHDSDHSYQHIMMEIAFAWAHMEGGVIIVDNVEQNRAFADFAAGTESPNAVFSSYDEPARVWQHGVLRKDG